MRLTNWVIEVATRGGQDGATVLFFQCFLATRWFNSVNYSTGFGQASRQSLDLLVLLDQYCFLQASLCNLCGSSLKQRENCR